MPTYHYKCQKCSQEFDIKQSMKDDKLTYCDNCKTESLERVIQAVGVVYKGNGWFKKNGSY